MKRFFVLAGLEIKRYVKAFPILLLSALVLGIVVCGIAVTGQKMLDGAAIEDVDSLVDDMTASSTEVSQEGGKVSAALVIQDESKAIPYAKKLLEKMESVQAMLDIVYVEEEEGEELLENGDIVVLIIVREKTISGIMHGDNIPVEVRFPDDSGYEAVIFKEFADAAVNMLSSSQAAIYSVYDFYKAYDKYDKKGDALDELNMTYIAAALNRHKMFEKQEVMVTGEVTTVQYYLAGSIVLFLMFFSIILVHFMERKGRNLAVRLEQSGTGYWLQSLASLLGPVLSFMCLAVIFAGVAVNADKSGSLAGVLSHRQVWQIVLLVLPMACMMSTFTLMICRLTSNSMAQVMCLFLAALMQGFIAGCFVPKILLPKQLDVIAGYLPAGCMTDAVTQVFTGGSAAKPVGMMLVFAGVFYVISVGLEYRRRNS